MKTRRYAIRISVGDKNIELYAETMDIAIEQAEKFLRGADECENPTYSLSILSEEVEWNDVV